jgi:hypothetical protein
MKRNFLQAFRQLWLISPRAIGVECIALRWGAWRCVKKADSWKLCKKKKVKVVSENTRPIPRR